MTALLAALTILSLAGPPGERLTPAPPCDSASQACPEKGRRYTLKHRSTLDINIGGILHGGYRQCDYFVKSTARVQGNVVTVTVHLPPPDYKNGKGGVCRRMPLLHTGVHVGPLPMGDVIIDAGQWRPSVRAHRVK